MPFIRDGVEMYTTRLGPLLKFSQEIIPAGDPKQEQEKILAKIEKTDDLILLLDERGKTLTSLKFAELLKKYDDEGRHITAIIGGAYGLSNEIRKRGHFTLSLSAMTLPHELAQLFFLEQLYRAVMIHNGSDYHHGN